VGEALFFFLLFELARKPRTGAIVGVPQATLKLSGRHCYGGGFRTRIAKTIATEAQLTFTVTGNLRNLKL